MRLSAPKQLTWWISVALGVLGLIGFLVTIPVISGLAFWLVLAGLVLLVLATFMSGL